MKTAGEHEVEVHGNILNSTIENYESNKKKPKKGTARLSAYPKGRIEIFDGKVWGTLCGHYWWDNEHGATNICKQLGYKGGKKYTAGGGVGLIATGNRLCKGGEATVYDCPLKREALKGCDHKIDQGVHCWDLLSSAGTSYHIQLPKGEVFSQKEELPLRKDNLLKTLSSLDK